MRACFTILVDCFISIWWICMSKWNIVDWSFSETIRDLYVRSFTQVWLITVRHHWRSQWSRTVLYDYTKLNTHVEFVQAEVFIVLYRANTPLKHVQISINASQNCKSYNGFKFTAKTHQNWLGAPLQEKNIMA
jgi:hypothetical protein